jgi:electron transfer flavoprotein beta subunit
MAAGRRTIPTWKAADLGLNPERVGAAAVRVAITDVHVPVKESKCEMIEGDSPAEQATKLAARLRDLKLI